MGELGLWMALCQLGGHSQGSGSEAETWEATTLVCVRDDGGVDKRKGNGVRDKWHCKC